MLSANELKNDIPMSSTATLSGRLFLQRNGSHAHTITQRVRF